MDKFQCWEELKVTADAMLMRVMVTMMQGQ
jgi:hypothetical protein